MQDRQPVGVVDRVDDLDLGAVGEDEFSAVAGLAAAARIEHGRVERDARRRGGEHARLGLAPVGLVAEKQTGRHRKACGMTARRFSQFGTGRFFSRRKAGLNSLEA